MKAKILDINGNEKSKIDLPKCFSGPIREDVVAKVLEAKKIRQPYGAHPMAGLQYSASGVLVHRRHVWKSQYGKGWSRVPRKILSKKGSQMRMEGATSPNTKGGRRAHPPKPISMMTHAKINKRELRLALISALSASANDKNLINKYEKLQGKKVENLPIIIESKFVNLKTKEIIESLKKILGKDLFEIAIKKKSVRAGKGKLRGRKYKSNAGMLLVIGKNEKVKVNSIDVANVKTLGVNDLAKGGVGRLVVYTEEAVKDLENKFEVKEK